MIGCNSTRYRGQSYAFRTSCFQPCPSQAKGAVLYFPHLLLPAMSQPAKQGDSPMLSAPVASSHVPASQARGQSYAFHTCCVWPCPSQAKGTDLCSPHLLRLAMSQPCSVTLAATALNIGKVPCFPHLTALDIGTTLCFPHHVPAKQCYAGCNSTPYRNSPMPSAPVASSHVPAKQCYIGCNSSPYRNSPMLSAPVASSHVPAKQCYIGCNRTPYRNSPPLSTLVASRHVPAKPCYLTWL